MSTIAATNLKNASSGSNNIVLNTDGSIGGTCLTQTCRVWVNFNGIGTVAIRGSYNVSSITDNGVGLYTVNFTTALADGNYSAVVAGGNNSAAAVAEGSSTHNQTSGSCGINISNVSAVALVDRELINVAIFR